MSQKPAVNPRRIEDSQTANELREGLAALRPELMSRALRYARATSAAEDIVQETMARALRFESQYQPGTNLRAWVGQILRSVFLTQCRRNRREARALASLHHDPCAWARPAPPLEMTRLSPRPARALASLGPGYRHVVRLVDLEGLSYREAAAALQVPVGTVMSRLHRGRRMLAELLRAPVEEASAAAA